MAEEKFLVRLVRPVFQAAYVEVEGRNENEAAFRAYTSAENIPEEKWTGRYNPEGYGIEVHCIRSAETSEGYAVSLLDFPNYCLLSTGSSPIGSSCTQPWMDELNPCSVASNFSLWIDSLIDERVEFYERSIEFFEDALKSLKGTDKKVVPLAPPAELRYNIELIEAAVRMARLLKEVD